jgi:hypothetical protein
MTLKNSTDTDSTKSGSSNEVTHSLKLEPIDKALGILTKLFLSAVAICYATGMIVVNISLSKHGYHSLNLIRVSYISAGAWALYPLLLSSMAVVLALYLTRDQDSRVSKVFASVLFSFVFGSVGMIWMLALALSWLTFWSVMLGGAVLGLVATAWFGIRAIETRWPFAEFATDYAALLMIHCWFYFIPFVAYTCAFGYFGYEAIPSSLGGGKPLMISFVADDKLRPCLQVAGFTLSAQPPQAVEAELLTTTDKELILLKPNSKDAVAVRQDSVHILIYGPVAGPGLQKPP